MKILKINKYKYRRNFNKYLKKPVEPKEVPWKSSKAAYKINVQWSFERQKTPEIVPT